MERFIGRDAELSLLAREWQRVSQERRGRFVLVRGRRQVGKSRLVEEFLSAHGVPHVYFQATRHRPAGQQLDAFAATVVSSSLPGAEAFAAASFTTWDAALALATAGADQPCAVVLDELPYLTEHEPAVEGALQTAWDRHLRKRPVLLIAVGSDLAMMQALTEYGRPLYGRPGVELVVAPLTPADVSDALDLDAAAAIDAYLVTGGYPLLIDAWHDVGDLAAFLRHSLADPTSPLMVAGERIVTAEFPAEAQPRPVLEAIGAGARTFTTISQRTGIAGTSLARALDVLQSKRVVVREAPLSRRRSRLARYVVADPYLRFWLRFLARGLEVVQRGRADLVLGRIEGSWPDYRGAAVEPLVRGAVARLLPLDGIGDATAVGRYWTRDNQVEVDIVGADRDVSPTDVLFAGSVKWRAVAPFDKRDLAQLHRHRDAIPGATAATPLLGVSLAGFTTGGLDAQLTAGDLIDAWRARSA